MSTYTLAEGFPMIPLTAGMQIALEAVDPTDGSPVADVIASSWAIYGDISTLDDIEEIVPKYSLDDDEDSGEV